MNAKERAARDILVSERRVAKRHGGWKNVDDSHRARAAKAKATLRQCGWDIAAAAKESGWHKADRRKRHDYIQKTDWIQNARRPGQWPVSSARCRRAPCRRGRPIRLLARPTTTRTRRRIPASPTTVERHRDDQRVSSCRRVPGFRQAGGSMPSSAGGSMPSSAGGSMPSSAGGSRPSSAISSAARVPCSPIRSGTVAPAARRILTISA
jgi:hypothetical protein